MRNKTIHLLCFLPMLFLVGCTNEADLEKIKTLETISNKLNDLTKDSLIVFDVDEVLITPIDPFFHINSISDKFWRIYLI